jgi:hypothetical protein
MGNGSPRLLEQLVRRTAVVALASLVFAPNAFADDAVVTVTADVGAVQAGVTVAAPDTQSAPATPAAPAPAVPAAPPAVEAASPLARVQAAAPDVGAATFAPTSNPVSEVSAGMSSAASRARIAKFRRSQLAERVRPSLPQRLGSIPRLPSAAASRGATRAAASSPPVPRFPIPSPSTFGFDGTSAAAPVGVGLLLLLLAAELAVLGTPGLGRRLGLGALSPRSHPHLFRLERPD